LSTRVLKVEEEEVVSGVPEAVAGYEESRGHKREVVSGYLFYHL
jgi:hypothetical protein